jgi:hypothetical protein
MIKGGDWISDALSEVFLPVATRVAIAPNVDYYFKKALTSNGWELGRISGG